ncbi:MAG TPA: phosphoribosylanthranilate isomerase [Terriglobales bacterium]|nr:phosphoribosylanthranilate isomerase [Terriglobales bacterium]
MTWVKICGIGNLEDARIAVEAGADALGFVFYPNSPRYVDPLAARSIVAALPAAIEKIGVFVDEAPQSLAGIAQQVGLTGVQLHLEPSRIRQQPSSLAPLNGVKQYVALRVHGLLPAEFPLPLARPPDGILLDSGTLLEPGGTGKAFDWEQSRSLVARMKKMANVVVAGGLTPSNVRMAMRILEPWGVDVASGVEARPGKKDPEKVRAFLEAVRDTDRRIP